MDGETGGSLSRGLPGYEIPVVGGPFLGGGWVHSFTVVALQIHQRLIELRLNGMQEVVEPCQSCNYVRDTFLENI